MTAKKKRFVDKNLITNHALLRTRFRSENFDGEFLASFGRPELAGSWFVFGQSGSGKTSFLLRLAGYLSDFTRVAYNSLEQGLSLSLKQAWMRAGLQDCSSRVCLLNKEPLNDLIARLERRASPNVIIVDSLHYWLDLSIERYAWLLKRFPKKLFIFVSHADGREPRGKLAQYIRYNSDVKIYVEGFRAFVTSRFADAEEGVGNEPFDIWKEGAAAFHAASNGNDAVVRFQKRNVIPKNLKEEINPKDIPVPVDRYKASSDGGYFSYDEDTEEYLDALTEFYDNP